MSEKPIKPVYLLYGDPFLVEGAIERLKSRLLSSQAQLDNSSFSGTEASARDILHAAETLPFMNEKNLVLVYSIDKLSAEDREKLTAYADNPAPTTCMVITVSSDRKTAQKIRKDSRIVKAVKKNGQVYEYKSLRRGELPDWIRAEFSKQGKDVTPEAIRYLIDQAGSSLRDLKSEIEKAALFTGKEAQVSKQDLEFAVSPNAESTIFEMVDSLGNRNRRKALSVLNRLLEAGEPPQRIFYMVHRQFRLLFKAKSLSSRNLSPYEKAKELGVPYFLVEKYLEQSANFSKKQLKDVYEMLWDTDLKVKRGEQPARLALELLIAKVA